jgi:transcriptional antiterminator NusG
MSRWYIIHAYSGFENKVRDAILAEAKRLGLEQLVEAVEVPTETVTEIKRGKKVQSERKFMPGYVLAKLAMTDDVFHLVKNTPKVTGFLGPNGKPQAIPDAQAARMLDTTMKPPLPRPRQRSRWIMRSATRSRCWMVRSLALTVSWKSWTSTAPA